MPNPLYVFSNWKMYVGPKESAKLAKFSARMAKLLPKGTVSAIFPSALSFNEAKKSLGKSSVALGCQNAYWLPKGGATGEVSAEMYKQAGAKYALVGHSERRHLFHETNHDVRQKLEAALVAGLIPILCVGETKHERLSSAAEEVIEAQLRSAYTDLAWPKKVPVLVAYEPVWAISHGVNKKDQGEHCDPDNAELMHQLIIHFTTALIPNSTPKVLYGGSVRHDTVLSYTSQKHVSGVLVGAASTKPTEWEGIIKNLSAS